MSVTKRSAWPATSSVTFSDVQRQRRRIADASHLASVSDACSFI
jgi:hypothetical protein